MGGCRYRCVSDSVWDGKIDHCCEIVSGAGVNMSDSIIKLARILCVVVGLSFSVMLVAIFIATAWRVLSLSGLIGG